MPDGQAHRHADEVRIIVGSREQLLHLLAEAAEVEHTLMCSYLYAAFSLKRAGEPGVSDADGALFERWRKTIMYVAVEEMGHLVMVANLTAAVGGRPHVGRPNFPVAPGYFPSGVAVRLTGFDVETLKHFIFLEQPHAVAGEDSVEFEQEDYHREQARPGLMPSAQDYATIGQFYEAIRANLITLHDRLGVDRLFIGGAASQVDRSVINLEDVEPIFNLATAQRTIDMLVEQGEGSEGDHEESHYRSFLAIQRELEHEAARRGGFSPAWPVADNPVLRNPPEPDGKVFIDHPEAARLLDFGCAAYGLLLRCLAQCFGRTGNAEAAKQALMSAAIELMHVVAEVSTALARLPASPAHAGVNAGMTFTMLCGVEPLPHAVERHVLEERAAALVGSPCVSSDRLRGALESVSNRLAQLP